MLLFILLLLLQSPLTTIAEVIKTKSSSSLEFLLCFAYLLNGSFWAVYGFVIQNYAVGVPNAIGAFFGLILSSLCFIYPSNTVNEDEVSTGYHADKDSIQNEKNIELNQDVTNIDSGDQTPSVV